MAKFKLNRNAIIWIGVIFFSIILGTTAVLYFQVKQIPVLTQDVDPGTQITAKMYKLVEVNPRDQLLGDLVTNPSELFKDGNAAGGSGKYTLGTMVKGQPIPKRLVTANPLDPKFGVGSEVQRGERAVSGPVNIENAVGGMVDKGNIVDLTYVPLAGGSPTSGTFSSTSLNVAGAKTIRNVLVLEVRNENGMPRYSGAASTGSASQSQKLIITFSLPEAEASGFSVSVASGGKISLALPSRLDAGSGGTSGGTPAPKAGGSTTATGTN